jgi:hypothetical protein
MVASMDFAVARSQLIASFGCNSRQCATPDYVAPDAASGGGVPSLASGRNFAPGSGMMWSWPNVRCYRLMTRRQPLAGDWPARGRQHITSMGVPDFYADSIDSMGVPDFYADSMGVPDFCAGVAIQFDLPAWVFRN